MFLYLAKITFQMKNLYHKFNNKLERINATLINGIIALIGIFTVLSILFLKPESEWKNILISVGCSLLASSIVSFLSSKYIVHISKVKEIIHQWGLEGIYETRQKMNISCDNALEYLENELDIIAWGLKSFRDSKDKKIKEKVQKGLKIRILTMNPYSEFVTQREKDEKEVSGQIKKTIIELKKWIDELKEISHNPEEIAIRFYNKLPQDFYFRADDHIYIGPYLYGISSQQTISYEFKGNSRGFIYHKDYFEKLWNDSEFCNQEINLKQNKLLETK